MRVTRSAWLAVALVLAALPQRAAAQAPETVRYWPLKELVFPVPVDKLKEMTPKPARLHFFARPSGGEWKEVAAKSVGDLDIIDPARGLRGFKYASPSDGQYEFALQKELANGDLQPATAELAAEQTVTFDTKPPVVEVARKGATGIEWNITDDNLRADGIRMEARSIGESKFFDMTAKGIRPKPRDSYTWTSIPPDRPFEVRIVAKDKANHETASTPIRLPGTGGATPGLPGAAPLPEGGRPGQPTMEYSDSRTLKIESKVNHVTRSGIQKSYLYMRTDKLPWAEKGSQKADITPDTKNPTLTHEVTVDADGTYGFVIIPENGAGGRDPAPKGADAAQYLIKVDTVPPAFKSLSAKASKGPSGPRVEVTWEAADENFPPEPILLEYAADPAAGKWTPITPDGSKLPNNGRYVWDVESDKVPWKFVIRASAVDLAGHKGDMVTKDEVKIDFDTPKAFVEKVTPHGKATGPSSARDNSGEVKPATGEAAAPPAPLSFNPPTPATPAKPPEPKPAEAKPPAPQGKQPGTPPKSELGTGGPVAVPPINLPTPPNAPEIPTLPPAAPTPPGPVPSPTLPVVPPAGMPPKTGL